MSYRLWPARTYIHLPPLQQGNRHSIPDAIQSRPHPNAHEGYLWYASQLYLPF